MENSTQTVRDGEIERGTIFNGDGVASGESGTAGFDVDLAPLPPF